ncbi:MAG TPA: 2-oxo acid dehydrogenase subunit E2 [Streptosporangiaceae bacterium]|nr:2-oxo acid dehydrogenase subunit E2 [Streptosporangiaceae bacterium]
MSVSVSMPQLGESVTEGTVTRWLKKEGERVEADEPLLEVSTDKVDTEIPSPVSGILRGITVAEDETVAVGAELAVIDEEGTAGGAAAASAGAAAAAAGVGAATPPDGQSGPPGPGGPPVRPGAANGGQQAVSPPAETPIRDAPAYPPAYEQPAYPPAASEPGYQQPSYPQPPAPPQQPESAPPEAAAPQAAPDQAALSQQAAAQAAPPQAAPQQETAYPAGTEEAAADAGSTPLTSGTDGPYVTPLVRKLAAEHGIDLGSVAGTGVGGRIRKQDVIDAARALRGPGAVAATGQPGQSPAAQAPSSAAPPVTAAAAPAAAVQPQAAAAAAPVQPLGQEADQAAFARPVIVPSSLRGTTEHMSRARQLIAKRMVESLQTSAQLTTVVEADVTAIARLRDRAKADFEAREGVKLSFLPFFALAAVEALKVHPRLNAVIDTASAQVTYHDAEHLGIAVDTDRGLMVPVIRKAGDLNIAGLARKIADLAQRTRAGRVSPDDLSGGTFTLTNTGSRGALFDTPIINQPQVAILGTGTVVKRPVVVEDAALGEVITVRSMVYLALTYDHRLVDGADAARFLVTMKTRLEEGAFETELGL